MHKRFLNITRARLFKDVPLYAQPCRNFLKSGCDQCQRRRCGLSTLSQLQLLPIATTTYDKRTGIQQQQAKKFPMGRCQAIMSDHLSMRHENALVRKSMLRPIRSPLLPNRHHPRLCLHATHSHSTMQRQGCTEMEVRAVLTASLRHSPSDYWTLYSHAHILRRSRCNNRVWQNFNRLAEQRKRIARRVSGHQLRFGAHTIEPAWEDVSSPTQP